VLEGGNVPVELRQNLWVVRLDQYCRPLIRKSNGAPGTQQRAVDRAGGRAQQVRDLSSWPGQHITQDQNRALARGQVLQRGNEGQPDALPGNHRLGRIWADLAEQPIRERLHPRHLGTSQP